jgi:hypothetical protein
MELGNGVDGKEPVIYLINQKTQSTRKPYSQSIIDNKALVIWKCSRLLSIFTPISELGHLQMLRPNNIKEFGHLRL